MYTLESSLESTHAEHLLGFTSSAVVSAAWRPKTTKSSKLLAPRRFAPCTEAQPACLTRRVLPNIDVVLFK